MVNKDTDQDGESDQRPELPPVKGERGKNKAETVRRKHDESDHEPKWDSTPRKNGRLSANRKVTLTLILLSSIWPFYVQYKSK